VAVRRAYGCSPHARTPQPAAAVRERTRHACTRNHDETNAPTRSQHDAMQRTHRQVADASLQHMGSGGGRQAGCVCPAKKSCKTALEKRVGPPVVRAIAQETSAHVSSPIITLSSNRFKFRLSRRNSGRPRRHLHMPAMPMQVRSACCVGRRSGISYQLSSASDFAMKDSARRRVAALLFSKKNVWAVRSVMSYRKLDGLGTCIGVHYRIGSRLRDFSPA
jgi:hypothetical protein